MNEMTVQHHNIYFSTFLIERFSLNHAFLTYLFPKLIWLFVLLFRLFHFCHSVHFTFLKLVGISDLWNISSYSVTLSSCSTSIYFLLIYALHACNLTNLLRNAINSLEYFFQVFNLILDFRSAITRLSWGLWHFSRIQPFFLKTMQEM